MNTLNLLEKKSREVQRLCSQYQELEDANHQSPIFKQMSDAMSEHNRIEHTLLRSAASRAGGDSPTREAIEEHLTLRRAIVDLLDMIHGENGIDREMDALNERINPHAVESKRAEPPRFEAPVSPEQCALIGENLEKLFAELRLQESPDAPPSKADESDKLN